MSSTATGSGPLVEPGSFRDRSSRVYRVDGEVRRALSAEAAEAFAKLADSGLLEELVARGELVGTERIVDGPSAAPEGLLAEPVSEVLRHEEIPFVSYPYEWPFSMLRDAARLQLSLLEAAIDRGLILKDATPYNVQWRGSRPLFIDVGSFEPLLDGSPWIGYRQFCMLFLYPLMLRAYKDVPYGPRLRGSLEGIPPSEMAALFSGRRDRLRRGVFKHVRLHSRLERRYASAGGEIKRELKASGFGTELVRANIRAVGKLVERLDWQPPSTEWTSYGTVNEYTEADRERKRAFVAEAAAARRPGLLWDLGCNDGTYTRVAAAESGYTVAIDSDETLIEHLYRELHEEGREEILPLAVNLADASPPLGWRAAERKSLTERGSPDLVLCLALVHHLSLSANIPIADLVDWLRELDASLVIEFVTREDPMVELLLGRKQEGTHPDYELGFFERRLGEAFTIERREEICEGRRVLYLARP